MKTLFLYNPHSGMMQIKNYLFDIFNLFSEADYDLTVFPTKKTGDAFHYIKEKAADFNYIICSGGDGTLNEVISGLMSAHLEKKPAIGYIPAGSTNDFAASINIPKNMKKSAKLAIEGFPHSYDIGSFNNRYFVYVAAFGAFTKVSYSTPQDIKNIIGHLAYLAEGIRSLADIRSYEVAIKAKDLDITDKFIYGMVTNTYSVGGLYKLDKKKVQLDDGLFEVLLIKEPKDLIELAEISSYLQGIVKESKLVLSFKTDKISFETKDDMPWTLDGEYGGDPKKVQIKVIEKAVDIISVDVAQ